MTEITYISSSEIVYDANDTKLKFMITLKTVEVIGNDVKPILTRTIYVPVDSPVIRTMKFITQ